MSNSKSNNDKPQANKNGDTKPLERAARDHKGIKHFKPDPDNADESEQKLRSQKSDEGEGNGKKKKREKKYRMRRFPIILRVVIVLALIAGAAILGAMIGYGIVGEGGDYRDVLDPETWWYIHDIIFSDTEFERER
ncbi:DNA-directed RNA polymerase subunit beta [Salisediminibacterium beveridgei]|uniref:DNA-directed RNA polymerase subunit beta n=1 Tax=Salisediminibacterium beveridgei TaxID=632773 RepID=A0A1D7QRI3_9BACI|nr:DNA-directed RNA polymerase subunit beta [Salisediminibacterium beveridgei]AOM81609.1 hypothetical protein BBEV_0214 [Salisediminibacterium beveridgei]